MLKLIEAIFGLLNAAAQWMTRARIERDVKNAEIVEDEELEKRADADRARANADELRHDDGFRRP